MESSPSAILKLLVPKAPFILKTALWSMFSLSDTSSKWDLRTELTVKILRDMLSPTSPTHSISATQKLTTRDPGVKGKVWVSRVKLAAAEDDARQLVFAAIEEMGTGEEQWTKPATAPLEGEWNGYRASARDDAGEPEGMSEQTKYDHMVQETSSKVTVLYFHGGAMYLLDPATYRTGCARLAKETGGRVFSTRYRLSPQNPFPAALLDCFTAYLSLLHPPPDAPHAPIPAAEIVFAGDSAGGMCCTALLQLLLHLHRRSPAGEIPTVTFHNRTVPIPLPAGLALASPWLDVTRSLPSIENLTQYDYLPPPSRAQHTVYPPCDAWPAVPERADLYCEGSALCHPLVSPLAALDWTGAPPVFFSVGEEMLRDEGAVLAQRMARQGVRVVWREFEAMPHVFAMMLEHLAGSAVHHEETGRFCRDVVAGGKGVQSSGEVIAAKTLERRSVDVGTGLTRIGDEEAAAFMQKGRERIEARMRRGEGSASAEGRPLI
ncbi:acetyl-hydrolase [Dothidotthia symphoricarpi CBS 119687]|uniref:Acetyl-hydrolase n=1 Tax=Dothidotthia symphoricarpi CBS 119687 TaxID=1392245 RepID=A0A6A6ANN0_9PLEO|nr:acetyl-hydrolase [Dothidotthia symphoricarpi CBS 119687]KAF2133400.1 acetyl-hydrolase [Dothidotthia symphoricarpi CBS 119687]